MRVNRMHANMIVQNIISYHQSFEEGIRQQNRLQTEYGRRILYILWLCCMQCMVKDADHVSRLIRLVVWELGGCMRRVQLLYISGDGRAHDLSNASSCS